MSNVLPLKWNGVANPAVKMGTERAKRLDVEEKWTSTHRVFTDITCTKQSLSAVFTEDHLISRVRVAIFFAKQGFEGFIKSLGFISDGWG